MLDYVNFQGLFSSHPDIVHATYFADIFTSNVMNVYLLTIYVLPSNMFGYKWKWNCNL
jgi:3-isopropylmalate dehydratase small subunit